MNCGLKEVNIGNYIESNSGDLLFVKRDQLKYMLGGEETTSVQKLYLSCHENKLEDIVSFFYKELNIQKKFEFQLAKEMLNNVNLIKSNMDEIVKYNRMLFLVRGFSEYVENFKENDFEGFSFEKFRIGHEYDQAVATGISKEMILGKKILILTYIGDIDDKTCDVYVEASNSQFASDVYVIK